MRKILTIAAALVSLLVFNTKNSFSNTPDTVKVQNLEEVIISFSNKETNDIKKLPSSISFITPNEIEGRKIINIKDLSSVVPNLFIPAYGSKLSVPIYIRGIGERSTGQSIGMYIDNAPYLNKSVFDFEFMDVSQIEVLRGPQGTLYGRNAMSGIINIKTRSPLDFQSGKISLTTGNYGLFRAKASASELISKNAGISLNAYYDGNDGYFKNQYSGKKADKLKSGGARLRLDWKLNDNWIAQFSANYDLTEQGAFPYGVYDNGKIASPYYNHSGSYDRETAGGNFNLNFTNEHIVFNSNTGFVHLNDDMKMDTDNSVRDLFVLHQKQKENTWTQEFTVKSNTKNNYQWLFGTFGFYNNAKTNVVTTMGKDGIKENIEDNISQYMPGSLLLTVKEDKIAMPGKFETPAYGGAIFHQSTYNNLFTKGLSVTAGIRFDYEKAELNYNTSAGMTMNLQTPGPALIIPADSTLAGKKNTSFKEILPKIAVKYEFDSKNYIYASISNGYKTGGYNIQNFADIARNALMKESITELFAYMPSYIPKPEINIPFMSVDSLVAYKPEYSWNYELGFKGELIKNLLQAEVAVYYITVKDIQLTDFVNSGQGRILKNAGKAESMGFDLSLSSRITQEFTVSANYGFSHAVFKNYKTSEGDYSDNYIPFAPKNTLSINAVYNKIFRNKCIDRFHIQAQYNAAGKIYWTEANDVSQNFYGLFNLRTGIDKGILGLNFWANNIFNEKYTVFYFESLGQNIAQKGNPFTFGVDVNLRF